MGIPRFNVCTSLAYPVLLQPDKKCTIAHVKGIVSSIQGPDINHTHLNVKD